MTADLIEAESAQDRYLTVSGLRIRYRIAGQGEPILLVHGLGASLEFWDWTLPLLSRRYQVAAFDLPGFGWSDTPPYELFSLEGATKLIAGVLDALGWRSATIIGNSMGGLLALNLALTESKRVDRLVLVNGGGLGQEVRWTLRALVPPLFGHEEHHDLD